MTRIGRVGRLATVVAFATLAACANKPEAHSPASAGAAARTTETTSATTTASSNGARGAPSSADARAAVTQAHRKFAGVREGKNADYIPALAKVDAKLFGVTLVTVDGEIYEVGDAGHPFAIESVSKIFTLSRVLQDLGREALEKRIGADATGMPFNSILAIELDDKHRAGNPFVNAGAITSVSLVPARSADERWSKIAGTMDEFAGRKLPIDSEIYKSESDTNTRNRSISWLLKSYGVIEGDPMEALDLYTRQCSVAVTAHDLAVMGATLANGGKNPVTGKQVVSSESAARALSMMLTTGLYETTGTWSLDVGVPAKSGVGGGIVAVVPGKYAIGTFSPPLDAAGNSVRGQRAIASITKDLGGNVFMASNGPRDARAAAR